MAQRLLKHFRPVLSSGGTSCAAEIIPFSAKSRSISFCAYRYLINLHHKDKFKDNVQLKHPLTTVPSTISFHQTSCSPNSITTKANGSSGNPNYNKNKNIKFKKTSTKSSLKEFTIKDKIGEHDMSIKLSKMQGLLEKGKTIEIFVKHSELKISEKGTNSNMPQIQKKLQDNLQGVTKIRLDYSNKTITKFTLVPAENEDAETKRDDKLQTEIS